MHACRFGSGSGVLARALTREHEEIDAGIERFVATERVESLLEAMQALKRHIYLEEELVFPPLNTGGLAMAIMVMYREHGQLWRAMDALTTQLDTGEGDPVAECRAMLELLERHNSKEEPVIYPHLDTELSEEAQATLSDFLARGSLPEGWRCRDAG